MNYFLSGRILVGADNITVANVVDITYPRVSMFEGSNNSIEVITMSSAEANNVTSQKRSLPMVWTLKRFYWLYPKQPITAGVAQVEHMTIRSWGVGSYPTFRSKWVDIK